MFLAGAPAPRANRVKFDGFDTNFYLHFQVLSNYLVQPAVLVCPGDFGRSAASGFQNLGPGNVTYRLRTDDLVTLSDPQEVLAVCPIDENMLFCDGSVTNGVNYEPWPGNPRKFYRVQPRQ